MHTQEPQVANSKAARAFLKVPLQLFPVDFALGALHLGSQLLLHLKAFLKTSFS